MVKISSVTRVSVSSRWKMKTVHMTPQNIRSSAPKPTWYLQYLHPVQQGRGNGRCGVCSGNKEHLGEVKGHIEVMVCEAVVLFWVQDLREHMDTNCFCVCVCVFLEFNHTELNLVWKLIEFVMDWLTEETEEHKSTKTIRGRLSEKAEQTLLNIFSEG